MSPSVFSGKTVDPLLAELIEEITDKLQAGAKVDLDRYLQQHPDWAEELRALRETGLREGVSQSERIR